ncbi:hypothetical protein [Reyranella sp.]|jgi:hypothetical protein|uniref:hypothetical protein n=1 Tax=Reyranella sp. TaxID=1929291 RepID=UPI002F92C743
MTATTASTIHPPAQLDFRLVLKGARLLAILCAIIAVFSPDPIAFAIGGAIPWLCLRILYTRAMPAALLYLFIWQWLQIFARMVQSWVDGQTLTASLSGPNVVRAYWYMMVSLVVLAVVFRLVLTNVKPATSAQRTAHLRWSVRQLVILYGLGFIVSSAAAVLGRGGLAQPAETLGQVKVVALFVLFVYVMSTGRGGAIMLAVVLFEIAAGFTGFLSDFRSVFIFLAIAAVTARIRLRFSTGFLAVCAVVTLTMLALFWTWVKADYREYASKSSDSQTIVVPLSDRLAYLGDKMLSVGDIDLGRTSYLLLTRFAYVDIFASVIDVQEVSVEPIVMRQWKEALEHVFKPRVFFPDKADLSDTEVYVRLTGRLLFDEVSTGTSISVGYMGENFADLGFPGMLLGIAVLGLGLAVCVRVLMSFDLPMAMREGVIMAFAFSMARDGVEVSLPKMIGAALMFMIIFVPTIKFVVPRVILWLDRPAQGAARRRSPQAAHP